MKKFISLFLILVSSTVYAQQDVKLNWQAPSEREDQSPLSSEELAEFRIYLGESPTIGEDYVGVDSSETEYTFIQLAPGEYSFRITSVDTNGLESSTFSNVARATVEVTTAPPQAPVITIEQTVYTVVKQVDRFIMLPVGTVDIGIECITNQVVNGYNVVPRTFVQWSSNVRPDVVVARCL